MKRKSGLIAAVLFATALVVPAQAQRFQGVDDDKDGRIQRSEWRGNARSFDRHDRDRNGVLENDELPSNMRRSTVTYADDASRQKGEAAVDKLDRNRSGAIEGFEWPYNANVFHELDKDANSVLTEDELNNLTSAAMRQLDTNGNNRIDSDEWPGGFAQFSRLDEDKDGKVSSQEYFGRGGEYQRRSRFDNWDRDRDGYVTSAEWQSNRALFNRLDTNRDARLDWNEFMASTERYDKPYGWR